jgi:hypothetical protein
VIVLSATMRATWFKPSGHDRGFVIDEMSYAEMSHSANHASSAAYIVETRVPSGLRISALRRMASEPWTRSSTASTLPG